MSVKLCFVSNLWRAYLRVSGFFTIAILTTGFSHAAPNPKLQNLAIVPISRLDQPWWRTRFHEKEAELHRGPVQLLWLGDSITQNWELDGPQQWRTFAPVWQKFYGDRYAVNLGFKGDSTCHLLWRLQNGELKGIIPKLAIILIGANNFGHIHTDAKMTEAGIQAVLDEVHKQLPQTRILLISVLPSIRSRWVSENTTRLNMALVKSTATRAYVTYLDVSKLFFRDGRVEQSKFLDPLLALPAPPLHPTAQAQKQLATLIEPTVARLLGDQVHH